MKILIVEDHIVLRVSLKNLLESAIDNCSVFEADDAQQCYALLSENTIDIVILDLNLPETHGFEILEKIKMLWPHSKVIVLSADKYEESGLQSIYKGAWAYLDKGVHPDILMAAIKTVYGGQKFIVPQINELLLKPHLKPGDKLPHENLTPREFEVMILIAKEYSYKKIAKTLNITEKTVGTHRSNLTGKMNIKKNSEITAYCKRHKLI